MTVQQIKQRYGIIGVSPLVDRAIGTAMQVAPTDLTVLITGESGTGKEVMPQIIHGLSSRKHGEYIAVNCGAIPEGTIDSELFGHEKGSFTGAHDTRKGYFEVANGGTIFLDEVAELPVQTQVRLLRVLETGEFIKVGSSKVQKTNVRIVAATNVDIPDAISRGRFREDLYYRLNTVPIRLPSLRERKEDIHMIFRKFCSDFAEKYRMPPIKLTEDAVRVLEGFFWPGNVRQLKNIAEQISVIEKDREIGAESMSKYLPESRTTKLPVLLKDAQNQQNEFTERELLYKVLFDMKRDLTEVKKLVVDLISNAGNGALDADNAQTIRRIYSEIRPSSGNLDTQPEILQTGVEKYHPRPMEDEAFDEPEEIADESLSLGEQELELIKRALEKHRGKRKNAAQELGISERTLYRKIKEHGIK